jgi:hypothetical protein
MAAMSLPGLAPVVGVLILAELTAGTVAVTYLADLLGEVGRGFLGSTAVICLVVMGLDLGLLAALPDPATLIERPVDPGRFASFVHWCVALCALTGGYALFCLVGTDIARRVVGAAMTASAIGALATAAAAFTSPQLGGAAGALVFVPAALLTGGTMAGMLLGHWYLLAPNLSFRPLRQAVYLIFAAAFLQAVAILVALLASDSAARHDVLSGANAVSFWLLVVGAGVVVTVGVNALAYHFARMRANQPATAMLYILVVSALMGVVPGHLLYFLTGVPV